MQLEERVSLATGIILRAVEAERDREPVESWVPAPGECLSDQVAERIRSWRKKRAMSRQQLADACAALGMPKLTDESFTNIESGRRQDGARRRMVSIDEVAVIAAALRVSPLVLVQPEPAADVRRGDFCEDDEPVGDVVAAFEAGEKSTTGMGPEPHRGWTASIEMSGSGSGVVTP